MIYLKNMKAWKITHENDSLIADLDFIREELKNIDTEEMVFTLEKIEISEEEMNNLPPYDGF